MRALTAATALALLAAGPAAAQSPTDDFARGHAAAAAGEWEAAWAAYRAAYDPTADEPRVVAALAATAEAMGDRGRFLALMDSVVAAHPGAAQAIGHRGAAALREGASPARVLVAFREFAEGSPERADAIAWLARILSSHGGHGPAEALLLEAIERSGESPALTEALAAVGGRPPGEEPPSRGGPAGLLADVEAARGSGEAAELERALARAREGGVAAALLAVPTGDLLLAAGQPDRALAAWGAALAGPTATAIEALDRIRLVRWLLVGPGAGAAERVGAALVAASADPARAAGELETAVPAGGDSLDVGAALLAGLAGELRGRGGDPAGASRALESAAGRAPAGESAALLLAAGTWAETAGESERARGLWRAVALEHPDTPYALEARRRLARGAESGR